MTYAKTDPERTARIQKLLEDRLGSGTAISFALIRDGEMLCAAAGTLGDGSGTPCDTESLFNVGSISKTFCAAAVLKLCETGKVDLDTPVVAYLPAFHMADERYRKITLRMCLNHSSGLPGTMLKDDFATRAGKLDDYRNTQASYYSETYLKAEPGLRSSYCNDGFDLASAVVSAVSGLSYTAFVKTYIAEPLGIRSLCTPEDFTGKLKHVQRRGFGEEFLNSLGAGGVALSIPDCARFGWSFLEPGKILNPESIQEMATPQCLASDPDDSAMDFGLGWDYVNAHCPELVTGPGTLLKSGGTPSFVSYLLVSPALRFAAAISATGDIGRYVLPVFLELTAAAIGAETHGASAGAKGTEEMGTGGPKPIPAAFRDRYTGIYYSGQNVYQVSFAGECLIWEKMSDRGWSELGKGTAFDGTGFAGLYEGEPVRLSFRSQDGIDYLNVTTPYKGLSQFAEKPERLPAANCAWSARDGRKYILKNGHSWDLAIGSMVAGLELKTSAEHGVVLAMLRGLGGALNVVPAAARDDEQADMFLTATEGGRNQFTIRVSREEGSECLHCAGYTFREAGTLPVFREDTRQDHAADACLCFRVAEMLSLSGKLTGTRIIALDEELRVVHDSRILGFPETVGKGYLILLPEDE